MTPKRDPEPRASEPGASEPDPRARFSVRAADYARHRPGYPDAALDFALSSAAGPVATIAADIGAGTGISARWLAARGLQVFAVEPNAAMRAQAVAAPNVTWLAGEAAATGLAAGSVGLVCVAQAFHWFDVEAATAEFARILAPAGRLMLVWNKRVAGHAFTDAYRALMEEFDAEPPVERNRFDPAVIDATGRFFGLRHAAFPNQQLLDVDALLGRTTSVSTVPEAGPRRDDLLRRLVVLHTAHADAEGRVALCYDCHVYTLQRASRRG